MLGFFRLFRIGLAVWGYLAWRVLVRLHLWRTGITPGQRLCRTLEGLGTTFVKLGQGLGLRRDLLPDDYVNALQGLQDHVPSFPAEMAVREVERSLGKGLDELFAEFDRAPVAAASIAQVHRARLHDGRPVIVKVRRPGIKTQVARDMRLLGLVVRAATFIAPGLKRYRPLDIIQEIDSNLRKEMDFRREARSIKRFSEAFADWEDIHIPRVIDDLYTESVMVQERSGGRRVDDPALAEMGPRLAQAFVDAYIHQFFVLGVFHGDPHPGNLFVREDGSICFHDFGLVGYLDYITRRNLASFMQAFIHQDSDWLLDAYLDLGVLAGELNREEFRHGLESLLQDYAGLPLKDWSFAEVFFEITRQGRGQNIRIPHNLLVLMRTFFLMETTVRSLDPEFNMLERLVGQTEQTLAKAVRDQASAVVKARLKYETAVAVQDLPRSMAVWMRRLRAEGIELRLQHRGLGQFEEHIDRSSNRLALALVTMGLYISSSLLMQHSMGPRWGEVPLIAAIGYGLALWFTFRLVRGIRRSGRL